MTDSLVARLREAIDDTERIAQAADFGPWEVGPTFGGKDNRVYVRQEGDLIDSIGTCVIAGQVVNRTRFRANAQHIARHDPQAVLRRCAADRKILDLHVPAAPPEVPSGWVYCTTCGSGEPYEYPTDWPCNTLLALAEAYGVEA